MKNKINPKNHFQLPYEPFGLDQNERVIEIPWALSHFKEQVRVLEIGPVAAQENYIEMLQHLNIKELHGLDITEKEVPGFKMKFEDIRGTTYPANYFDLVLCISTIEHVGRDNKFYNPTKEFDREESGDIKAIKEMARILNPGGSLLLSVPYGKYNDEGWFVNYSEKYLSRLIDNSNLKLHEERYFNYVIGNGWYECDKKDLKEVTYRYGYDYKNKYLIALGSGGLACLEFRK